MGKCPLKNKCTGVSRDLLHAHGVDYERLETHYGSERMRFEHIMCKGKGASADEWMHCAKYDPVEAASVPSSGGMKLNFWWIICGVAFIVFFMFPSFILSLICAIIFCIAIYKSSRDMKLRYWWIIFGVTAIVSSIFNEIFFFRFTFLFSSLTAITFFAAVYKTYKWFTGSRSATSNEEENYRETINGDICPHLDRSGRCKLCGTVQSEYQKRTCLSGRPDYEWMNCDKYCANRYG